MENMNMLYVAVKFVPQALYTQSEAAGLNVCLEFVKWLMMTQLSSPESS